MPGAFSRILVTGGGGFVGRHLLAALAAHWPEATLHATVRTALPAWAASAPPELRWHRLDVRRGGQVAALVRTLRPAAIIHLAAQSHVPTSFAQPELTWRVNLQGSLNLLESLRCHSADSVLLQVGSADMYGATFQAGEPVSEAAPLAPLNPYAASKAAADLAAGQYAASDGLRVVRARPFNHTGPGQRPAFALAAFAAQIARIEAGRQAPVLETGNLAAERDFLDVEDVVAAYLALLTLPAERQRGQAYNVASGQARSMAALLQALLARARCPIEQRLDPARQRPADIARVQADITRITRDTAWRPQVSEANMLARLLDHARHVQASTPG